MASSGSAAPVRDRVGNRADRGAVSAVTASVLDVFASRQGEGPCVGDPQVFIRFGGCNLVCDYCDTPESIPLKSGHTFTVEEVLAKVEAADPHGEAVAVSLTGGEPLLQVEFLKSLIPSLRSRGYQIYLETNGSLPRALEKIASECDWIAMDIKNESATGHDLREAHRWFLNASGKKVFVKLVLTDRTSEQELRDAVSLIATADPSIPLILQPATPWGQAASIPLDRLVSWYHQATQRLRDVRILPQVHRLWDIP